VSTRGRGLLIAGAVALAVLVAPGRAGAAPDDWAGSAFDAIDTAPNPVIVSGVLQFECKAFLCGRTNDIVTTSYTVTPKGHLGDFCTVALARAGDSVSGTPGNPDVQPFSVGLDVSCNGVYQIDVGAHAQWGPAPTQQDWYTLSTEITVANPAPPVTNVTTKTTDRDVAVSWTKLDNPPPDFSGYKVTRRDASGTVVALGTTKPALATFTDKAVPDGTYHYEVQALRNGADPSAASSSDKVVVGNGLFTTPPSSSSSDLGLVITGDVAPPATNPSGSGITVAGTPSRGSGVRPGSTAQNPSVGSDEGFASDLPYEAEPGGQAAQAPGVRASSHEPGAGLLVPGAVALLLLVWAMHILYVTRQARYFEAGLLPVEVEHLA
jgi:hypothetical protein